MTKDIGNAPATPGANEQDVVAFEPVPVDAGVSRRTVLKGTTAAGIAVAGSLVAAGQAFGQGAPTPPAFAFGTPATAATGNIQPTAPAIASGTVAGMTFKAFFRRNMMAHVEDIRLNELDPRHVLVRTEASCGCYTVNGQVLAGGGTTGNINIPNHSGVGTVVAIGSQVHRVRVGDRCLVSGTSQCGVCYQCLNGAPEACNYLGLPARVIGTLASDPAINVVQAGNIGGFAEYMVGLEEYCVPIFSELPSEQIAMLGDTFGAGFASTQTYSPVWAGMTVVIFGAGPVGLAAVQGANAGGAGQIIVVEPIPYRQQKARDFGATTVFDPNGMTQNELVAAIRALCGGPTTRIDAGGRYVHGFFNAVGADLVIEATGGDYAAVPPIVAGPDPTGIQAMTNAYNVVRGGGALVYLAIGQQGMLQFAPTFFAVSTKRIYGGQMGGQWVLRDNARYIKAAEAGRIDIGAVVTKRVPLTVAGLLEGYQGVASRSELGVVIMPQMSA